MGCDKRPRNRAFRMKSENNSLSGRLSGGETDIQTLRPFLTEMNLNSYTLFC